MPGIDPEKIGYYGRPITDLTRDELINAFIDLVSIIQNCAKRDGKCKDALQFIEQLDNG